MLAALYPIPSGLTAYACNTAYVKRRKQQTDSTYNFGQAPLLCILLTHMDLPADVIRHVLCGHVGPSTFATVRQVNRAWASACCEDAQLFEAVASYVDELTRTQFRGLLRLSAERARTYPHTTRRLGPCECYLYAPITVRRALRDGGGLEGLRARPIVMPCHQSDGSSLTAAHKRRSYLDERLHVRKLTRLAFACMRELPPESTRLERQQAWQRERALMV